ncbi:MAG: hypothetical protein ABI539_06370, partial [Acidobacteriota bacterium]
MNIQMRNHEVISNALGSRPLTTKKPAKKSYYLAPQHFRINFKRANAAQMMIPFLLELLDIRESVRTRAISDSVVELDNLARQFDTAIDTTGLGIKGPISVGDFEGLESGVIGCLEGLSNYKSYKQLVKETIDCVNLSFRFNTIDRYRIYDLNSPKSIGCTTYYLLPLINELFAIKRTGSKAAKLFLLTANYLQVLDDFVDLPADI